MAFSFLAALCIGSCLLIGYFLGKPNYGALSSLGALTILYFTSAPITQRMIHLVVCAGIIFSFTISSFFSFNAYFAALSLGIVSFWLILLHLILKFLRRETFSSSWLQQWRTYKFDLELIPLRVGLVAMGAILSCSFAFYILFLSKK
jgi:hypothetical protein